MPSCAEFLAHLSEYHDGRLDRRAARRIDTHLRRCERCVRALMALRRGLDVLRDEGDIVPSPWFRRRLAERLAREVTIGDPIQPTHAGLAAALVIGAAVGLALLEPLLHEPPVPAVAQQAEREPFRLAAPARAEPVRAAVDPLPVNVTLGFVHVEPAFSSTPRPQGMLALFAR